MDKSVITVNIFGNEYTIKGVAKPDYIISLANYLNNKMTEVQEATGLKDAKKIAILAAINIADELFEANKTMKESFVPNDQLAAIRNKVEGLIASIDKDLPTELTTKTQKDKESFTSIAESPVDQTQKPNQDSKPE
ncbi:MAG: cell division protein ZapA [bacterium]